jgi:uncharacterized membrane protein YczE
VTARRLAQLYGGLVLYGASAAMLVLAGLGLDPWDVLHQGLSRAVGLGVGTWVIIVGAAVLALWWPLRQRPGFGTVSKVVVVGGVMDVVLALVTPPHALAARVACLVGGVGLNGVATGAYIGAGLGAGPRDGLTLGVCARTGLPIRAVRTAIELSVLATGWLLGGTVGIGTVTYALAIGPITHITIPALARGSGASSPASRSAPSSTSADGPAETRRRTAARSPRQRTCAPARAADP